MAFPNSVNVNTPAGSDSPSLGDDQFRALKTFICDMLGLTSGSTYSASALGIATNGDVTLTSGTLTTDRNNLSGTATWNAGGVTFTGWKLNVTDTTSAAASLLVDLQVGGTSKFKVSKAGVVTSAGGLVIVGTLTGVTDLTMSGALATPTSLTMNGAISGVTNLGLSGTISGGTTISASTSLSITANTNQIVLGTTNTGTMTMAALSASRTWTFPNVTGTVVTTGDTGSVTNTMLAGSIAASKLIGTDIATVGTVTAGTWSADTIAVNKGGTGQTSYTNGQLLIGNTTGNTLDKGTLTAGENITITNGGGSITVAASVYGTGMVRGLIAVRASTTTYELTSATQIAFHNPSTDTIEFYKESQGVLTLNSATAGPTANGRDQAGAFTAGQWLHVYYIRNGSTIASILSDALPPTGPELPSGYTSWAYAFSVYWNGSSNFIDSYVRGNVVAYASSASALSSGAETTFTPVSLSAIVPPQAISPTWWGYFGNNNNSDTAITIDLSLNGTSSIALCAVSGATGNLLIASPTGPIPNVSQTIYYKVDSGSGGLLLVSGYTVANGG